MQANEAAATGEAAAATVPSSARIRGAAALVASASIFPLCGMTVRRLRDALPAVEIAFLWCALSAAGLLLLARIRGFSLRPKHLRVFVARGVCGATVTGLFFMSVQRIPLGTATLLLFSEPIWVAVFSAIRGVEKPRPLEWLLVGVAFVGVVLIADPVFGNSGLGEALALLAGIFAAGSNLTVREMRRRGESIPTTYFAFLLAGTVLLAPFAFAGAKAPTSVHAPWLAMFLVVGTIGNILMTYGFRFVTATSAAVAQTSEVAFAIGWAYLVLGEVPTLRAAGGGVVLLGSVVALTALRSLRR